MAQQSRVDYYKNLIDPKVTAVAGVGAWVGALVLSFFVVTFFSLAEKVGGDLSGIDMSHWMLTGGIGGGFESQGTAFDILQLYAQLDSNYWGVGPILHYLIPALVLILAGRAVAGHFLRNRPNATAVDTVVVSAALAVPFVVMLLLGSFIFTHDNISYDIVSLLVMGLAYPLVFASIGAAMRTRAAVTSINGLIAGVGSFVLGFGIWYFIVDPFADMSGVDGWGDLPGSTAQFDFLAQYLGNHALGAERFFPEWYIAVAALVGGVALAYYLKVRDPLAGMGKGAHVGVGYFILATLVAFGAAFTRLSDAMEYDTWPDAIVTQVNATISGLSAQIILAGVVYPVAFAAIGGAIGAKVYETQSTGSRQGAAMGPGAQQGGSPPPTGPGGQQSGSRPPAGSGGQPPQGGSPPPAGGQSTQPSGSPPPAEERGQPSPQGGSPPPAEESGQPPQGSSPPPAEESGQQSRRGGQPPTEEPESDDDTDGQPPQR
jgi:hypothetical protein